MGKAPWSDDAVLGKIRELTLPLLERHGPVEAWIIDDTGFPKKGKHSVGVARQYCGQLGKQDNCQTAVSLSIANRRGSLPIAYRLYLPQDWASDEDRRRRAGVPGDVTFLTKPEIALKQIAKAYEDGVPQGVVLMDAGYGGRVEERRGSLGHAATPRFPSPLIKPDVPISSIRLSDWLHVKAIGGLAPLFAARLRTPSSPKIAS